MTALHQFGAEMLKLSKRLESYPTAAPPTLATTVTPMMTKDTPSPSIHTSRFPPSPDILIRSTANASKVIQQQHTTNEHEEVGDERQTHYNTRLAIDGHHYEHVNCQNAERSPLVERRRHPLATRVSKEQERQKQPQQHYRYVSSACTSPHTQQLFTPAPQIATER